MANERDDKKEVVVHEHIITPGQLVYKRFMKNKLAIFGLVILVVMFLFAFIGPFFSPYGEYEIFYTSKANKAFYLTTGNNELIALNGGDGQILWRIQLEKKLSSEIVVANSGALYLPYEDGSVGVVNPEVGEIVESLDSYTEPKDGVFAQEEIWYEGFEFAFEDGYIVATSKETGVKKWDFTGFEPLETEPFVDEAGILYTVAGDGEVFAINPERGTQRWSMPTGEEGPYTLTEGPIMVKTLLNKSLPSKEHILGTDRMGLDIFTRLMYGGRISLLVGFVVIIIELSIGIVLGGISGYYGKWIDNIIMRIVDVFNCIPTLPIMLILSSIMISLKIPPQQKIYVLMLLLGFLGWPYIARVIRGQILSLREMDFIVAVEATGIRPMRRIFKHLIPNVMPQLIVISTLSIGGVILTESALSYLGVGLSFPYASWGNMVDAVNDPEILRNFLNIWVPPGVCILLTVMAFNFVGDGLRDAFDPKMKR